jgi:MoaA/NifB/PqqE/SkfB family radical SAM enzyme
MSIYSIIKELDIEHSAICNAACPSCTREIKPGDYSWFNQTYLPENIYSQVIPQEILDNLDTIFFSGMVGDPCAAPNFLEVCKIIKSRAPHINIKISTNGGMRGPEWWGDLAKVLGKGSWVRFAIDGLEDTNHIYRINVRWDKVVANSKAFIEAGGEAEWQWIAFKHNEHQVEQARRFASEQGFNRFIVRKSHKFLLDALFEMQSINNKLHIKIEQPTNKALVHPLILNKNRVFKIHDALSISNNSPISCEAQRKSSVYISAEGYVFPCVYTGTCFHLYKSKNLGDSWTRLWETYGGDKVNLHQNNWSDIINGEFFKQIKNGWTSDYNTGRLAACGLICSESAARIFDPCIEYDVEEKLIATSGTCSSYT